MTKRQKILIILLCGLLFLGITIRAIDADRLFGAFAACAERGGVLDAQRRCFGYWLE